MAYRRRFKERPNPWHATRAAWQKARRHRTPRYWPYAILVTGSLLTGCATVGPVHVQPQLPMPASWTTAPAPGAATVAHPDPAALAAWWTTLNDPVLTALIDRAVVANLDVRQAEARVLEARARRGIASADRFPLVAAGASSTSSSRGDAATTSLATGVDPATRQVIEVGGRDTRTTLFSIGVDASWEVDLFGRRRRGLEAATASLQASAEDLRDVLVTLTSDVALNYLDVRIAQARLATADANLRTQTETHEIAQFRFQAGLVTQLDVERARLNLEQTRASIPALRRDLAQAVHRAAILLGQPPGALAAELTVPHDIPTAPMTVAVGLPADVLRRRSRLSWRDHRRFRKGRDLRRSGECRGAVGAADDSRRTHPERAQCDRLSHDARNGSSAGTLHRSCRALPPRGPHSHRDVAHRLAALIVLPRERALNPLG